MISSGQREAYMLSWALLLISALVVFGSPTRARAEETAITVDALAAPAASNNAALLDQARDAMLAENYTAAVQLYSKVLRAGDTQHAAEALELLGLARERNGQVAHAASEYRRYLSDYAGTAGAARVQQRLDGLMTPPANNSRSAAASRSERSSGRWDAYGGISQYYRSDTFSTDGREDITQSAVLTDIDFLTRRDGDRLIFEARGTAGNYYDLASGDVGPGNDSRTYYLYADLQDLETGLGARIGRQRLYSSGILGRFDGAHIGWQFAEDWRVNVMAGYPIYSSSQGADHDRQFYGASLDMLDIGDVVDVSLFFNQQQINGITDRQAVGGELRYFDNSRSVIASADFDVEYGELNNLIAISNWVVSDRLTLSASFDHRRSPYLLTENALIGQQARDIEDLLLTFTEAEIRQLAEERSGELTTLSTGLSQVLTQRFHLNADITISDYSDNTNDTTLVSGLGKDYFVNVNLVGSSLFKEGDTILLGARYQDADRLETTSVWLDARYPISQNFRVNFRMLMAQRKFSAAGADENLLIPTLRLTYRAARWLRLEFESGARLARRDSDIVATDSTSWFVYSGYRADF